MTERPARTLKVKIEHGHTDYIVFVWNSQFKAASKRFLN